MTQFLLAWFGVFSSPATVRHFPARAFQLLFINCCSTFLTLTLYSVTNYSVKSDWFSNMKKLCKLVALKDLSKAYLLIRFWHS